MENIGELWNEYHRLEIELKAVKARIEKFRENCEHMWEPEDGYLFSGFYCRRCGSTKWEPNMKEDIEMGIEMEWGIELLLNNGEDLAALSVELVSKALWATYAHKVIVQWCRWLTNMSEIIKKIEAQVTGKRYMKEYAPVPILLHAEEKYNKPVDNPYLTEYFVGVKFGHTVKIEEGSRVDATNVMKKAITEFIFGEFRSDLAKLQYQLYDRDFEEAMKTAKNIEQRMFYDK